MNFYELFNISIVLTKKLGSLTFYHPHIFKRNSKLKLLTQNLVATQNLEYFKVFYEVLPDFFFGFLNKDINFYFSKWKTRYDLISKVVLEY